MKTVSKHEAAEGFESLGKLVHAGETVLVVHAGKPWLKMVPAPPPATGKSAADFKARLDRLSHKPIAGRNGKANTLSPKAARWLTEWRTLGRQHPVMTTPTSSAEILSRMRR